MRFFPFSLWGAIFFLTLSGSHASAASEASHIFVFSGKQTATLHQSQIVIESIKQVIEREQIKPIVFEILRFKPIRLALVVNAGERDLAGVVRELKKLPLASTLTVQLKPKNRSLHHSMDRLLLHKFDVMNWAVKRSKQASDPLLQQQYLLKALGTVDTLYGLAWVIKYHEDMIVASMRDGSFKKTRAKAQFYINAAIATAAMHENFLPLLDEPVDFDEGVADPKALCQDAMGD